MTFGTFQDKDVKLLLKDITGLVEPQPAAEREPLIQAGVHYSEMLPLEYVPTSDYLRVYDIALSSFAGKTASAVASVSAKIVEANGEDVVLVSLARAGIPVGILIKRYLGKYFDIEPEHYAISIIRGKGIDRNAMALILGRHNPESIRFVDGWTGKGAIQRELNAAMAAYPGVDSGLAVLSDPAFVSGVCGTHEDFLIASSCLNSTVSGLLSRTFLRDGIIGDGDYHGAAYYKELVGEDRTYEFIDEIESHFEPYAGDAVDGVMTFGSGIEEARRIASEFRINDINLIKPGVGEATRVLLRRLPWKILVHSLGDHENLGHIFQLANEKGVEVVEYPLSNYKACGIIREMADS